ncbi:MAG: hypothetical protein FWD21_04515 [Peptococcaceae bacterium]|nr:hypothetical protein [Peptococcaceae bacterium]
MIVAREKTGSYGFFEETIQQKRSSGRKSIINTDKLALTLFVFAIFGVGVFVISYFAQMSALGYKIDQYGKDMAVLRVENQALEEQIQQMVALSSVESVAVSALEMVRPEVSDYMLLTVTGPELELEITIEGAVGEPEALSDENMYNPLIVTFDRLASFFTDR